jgi:hypothetical protein
LERDPSLLLGTSDLHHSYLERYLFQQLPRDDMDSFRGSSDRRLPDAGRSLKRDV